MAQFVGCLPEKHEDLSIHIKIQAGWHTLTISTAGKAETRQPGIPGADCPISLTFLVSPMSVRDPVTRKQGRQHLGHDIQG